MNTTDAHKLVNPKLLEVLEYLDALKGKSTHGNCCTCIDCHNYHDECTCEKISEAKSILKGILIAQESEIEFLDKNIETRVKLLIDNGQNHLNGLLFEMKGRLEALKLSNEDLKRRLI